MRLLKAGVLRRIDFALFVILFLALLLLILTTAHANLQADAVDYYSILAAVTHNDDPPLVENLHFMEQRSPGYPLTALLPYYLVALPLNTVVDTQQITNTLPSSANFPPPSQIEAPPQLAGGGSEMRLIPSVPISLVDSLFTDYAVPESDGWLHWRLTLPLLITSYGLLLVGILINVRTLWEQKTPIVGATLPLIVIFTSSVFMLNILNLPMYATLTAFGYSAIFLYFWTRGSRTEKMGAQLLAGFFMGWLVLTRLEAALLVSVLILALFIRRDWRFARNMVLGGTPVVVLWAIYNWALFDTPLHFGILNGDINQIAFDAEYILTSLFAPQSGLLFVSPLVVMGLAGLFFSKRGLLIALGTASIALIALLVIRMPVMYTCIGQGTIDIGGLPITCPASMEDMRTLIRWDINRYIAILIPFSVLGLHALGAQLAQRISITNPSVDFTGNPSSGA